MINPAIDQPWTVGLPAEAPDAGLDVGPFAATPTSFEAVGLWEPRIYRTGRIVASPWYGWAISELISVEAPAQYSSKKRWLDLIGHYYVPTGTLTSLESASEDYATVFTGTLFSALRRLALRRVSPWMRFLAGLDPVASSVTATIAPQSLQVPVLNAAKQSEELRAVEDLKRWLGITYEQVATAAGIALRTVHHWKKSGATPRPRTVRTLWRLHALVHGLRRALGPDEATEWLRSGQPSPLDLIVAGDITAVEARARRVLFKEPLGERRFSGAQTSTETRRQVTPRTQSLARADRRPKIARGRTVK